MENNKPDVGSLDQCGAKKPVRQSCVVVWDKQPRRRARIRQLVSALGARSIEVLDVQRLVSCSTCSVAVVAAGTQPDGAGMCAIRDLKSQGFQIVAYEDGSESWGINFRCLSLLAGASQLLDSEGANFTCRIQDALVETLGVGRRGITKKPNRLRP